MLNASKAEHFCFSTSRTEKSRNIAVHNWFLYSYMKMGLKTKYIIVGVAVAGLVWWRCFVASGRHDSVPAPLHHMITTVDRVGPASAYPDSGRTPGFVNPDITQANVEETICNPNWSTRSIRPPESYTSRLKSQQMHEWGLPGTAADYEEDHLISLELGGSPSDPRNLWPEAYRPKPGAGEKDVVENYLHKQVCTGALTLEAAQKAIATDWYRVYMEIHR
jgi:hypothetical protein